MSLRTRRLVVLTGFATALIGIGGIASGAWNLDGGGNSSATATTIASVTGATASASYNSASLNWSGVAAPVPATSYLVVRTAPTPVATISGCTLTGCNLTGLSASSNYTYTVSAVRDKWTSSPVPVNVTTGASPTPSAAASTLRVSAMSASGKTSVNNSKWTTAVLVTVVDQAGNPVVGATVTGSFSKGANSSVTCTALTNSSGQCTTETAGNIDKSSEPTTVFTPTVAKPNFTYNSAGNSPATLSIDWP